MSEAPIPKGVDNLSGPLLRMASFFLGPSLSTVESVQEVHAQGRALIARGLPVTPAESLFLRQVTWCMLQVQREGSPLDFAGLAVVAGLSLAIIEDDDFTIPDDYGVGSRENLIRLGRHLGAAHAGSCSALERTLARVPDLPLRSVQELDQLKLGVTADAYLARALDQGRVYLTQGEELLGRQADPERAAKHRQRMDAAYERLSYLAARLIALPAPRDNAVVRAHLTRRELKHVEIDALGAERISEAEQAAKASELLAWTQEDLGEELTESNKADLAARLAEVTADEEEIGMRSGWLFDME